MADKKKFFEIEIPIVEEKAELLGTSEENLAGRTVKIDLTRKMRGKSVEAVFNIVINDKKAKAEIKRLHILGYFIRRMMRKSIDYVEDSFTAQCKDASLLIKPFLITRKKVSREVRNALRTTAKKEIELAIKDLESEKVFVEVIQGRLQKALSLKLKKVYPLGFCDITDLEVKKR